MYIVIVKTPRLVKIFYYKYILHFITFLFWFYIRNFGVIKVHKPHGKMLPIASDKSIIQTNVKKKKKRYTLGKMVSDRVRSRS